MRGFKSPITEMAVLEANHRKEKLFIEWMKEKATGSSLRFQYVAVIVAESMAGYLAAHPTKSKMSLPHRVIITKATIASGAAKGAK
ncbi:hypothetical protein [Vibrio sp. SCSIO 43137]|uniref:hypothetical protein n=1 Tax=Vibrio sp. SCSIO 43137 TaxID=3021011 RepID=UPI0023076553|nr:hypothetical protein [Vibrio sp. SCSIO 43137]WCE31101.1 hypothetical protein PK654_07505 [Vibrio sp. SCSIO 43137]